MINYDNVNLKFVFDSDELEDIVKCLSTLYTTVAGTAPMDRNFGIDNTFLDMPINVAENLYALEVTEKTEIYEPRVNVVDVDFISENDGVMIPIITLDKGDEYNV